MSTDGYPSGFSTDSDARGVVVRACWCHVNASNIDFAHLRNRIIILLGSDCLPVQAGPSFILELQTGGSVIHSGEWHCLVTFHDNVWTLWNTFVRKFRYLRNIFERMKWEKIIHAPSNVKTKLTSSTKHAELQTLARRVLLVSALIPLSIKESFNTCIICCRAHHEQITTRGFSRRGPVFFFGGLRATS